MNLEQLFTFNFWFFRYIPMQPRTELIIFVLCVAVLIVGFVMLYRAKRVMDRVQRMKLLSLGKPLVWLGILEMFALFFHYERTPWLNQRVWFVVIFLIITIIAYRRYVFVTKIISKKIKESDMRETIERYLPRRK